MLNTELSLYSKIKSKNAIIGVIGLGYVGLELAITIAKKKYKIYGFDTNFKKIKILKNGKSPLNTINSKSIKFLNKNNLFHANKIKHISNCDIIIICLPTPLKKNNSPDVSYLDDCYNSISPYLRKNQMLILESTVYPGATKELFEKKISKRFEIGKTFNVCFSPERISPGKKLSFEYSQIPKIISGRTKECVNNISTFYNKIFQTVHLCETIEIAEFTKLYENAFRAVNIAFVNQMKIVSDKMGINIFEVVKAASTKPFGFTPFSPGPGVGGHCIPIDPMFITYVAKKIKVNSNFIELARKVNFEITNWIVKKIKNKIKTGKNILILGVAYKKNIDDYRESPAIKIIDQLKKDYVVKFYDPYINKISINSKNLNSIKKLLYKKLKNFSAVVIVADHDNFDYKKIVKYSKIIFDTRNVLANNSSKKIISC